jgi:ABC-type lipoprotein release transport system permease subunit
MSLTITDLLLRILVWGLALLLGFVGIVAAILFTVAILISGVLLVLLVLQAVGLIRRVPFSYNLRNLAVRWHVTLLTALAFTLVVGILTVMLAFVNGMNKLTEGSGQPGNVIVLADGATDELFSNLGFGDIKEAELNPGVERDEEGKPLASWEIYVVVNQEIPGAQAGGRQRRFVQARGIDDPARSGRVHNITLHPGGAWFSTAGVQSLAEGGDAIQAVIGEGIARQLGKDEGKQSLGPGDQFELGARKWIVTGVMQSAGSTFDSEVWAKRDLVGSLFGKASYTTVVLRSADAEAARVLAKDLTANYKKPAVQAQPETEYYEKLSTTNQQFLYAIIFVTVIMAVGGVFGVMNTMFAAVSQRTKDIGVLRILGFARWQVLSSFFLEALLLAFIGGLLGCALGSLANGWTATSIISSGQGGGGKSIVLKLVVDLRILTAGMTFTVIMGALGGLIPSLSAMRLRPLESLR